MADAPDAARARRRTASATVTVTLLRMLPPRPTSLPFLECISWFDAEPYEGGMQHHGVLGSMSAEERAYLGALAKHFGSFVDVSDLRWSRPEL